MNGAAPTRGIAANPVGGRWILPALLCVGCTAIVVAFVAGNEGAAVAVGPILAILLLCALWVLPLRTPLFVLIFLGIGIDATDEGPWNSPLAGIGHLVNHNLNKSIPVDALAIPLLGLALIYLLIILIHRQLTGSRLDGVGRTGLTPIGWALGVSLLAVLAECSIGYASGGNMQMAKNQVQVFVMTLLMAYLLAAGLRGVRDYRILGWVILGAACSKAVMALWVHYTFSLYQEAAYVTTHGDSILFGSAVAILIARFAEHPVRRNALWALGVLPLLMGAIIANQRRIAWLEVLASLLVVYFLGRRTQIRRVLTQAAVPLVLAYVVIGWNSNASVFAPIRSLRTVSNAEVDASTLFRDIENFNLLITMRMQPIIGIGFGQQFAAPEANFDLSHFKEYRYMPHNSVLGLLAFTGWLGFTGLFTAVVAGVFWAARSYRFARLPDERAAALSVICVVVVYLIQCWGDLGFSEREAIHLLGPALAVAGHLALSTGAYAPSNNVTMAVGGRL